MFDSYDKIFNKRGLSYHKAMRLAPSARQHEFEVAISGFHINNEDIICDMPSGGGYLAGFLPQVNRLEYIAVDPSESFADTWKERTFNTLFAPLDRLPMDNDAVDKIVSIAGLHHIENLNPVFKEMRRILRPDGELSILEVASGSITDTFLNVFVNQYNSMGHQGCFIDESFRLNMQGSGFTILQDNACRYTWNFIDEAQMIEFIKLMFGLDKASGHIIADGIDTILGVVDTAHGISINWELQRIIAN